MICPFYEQHCPYEKCVGIVDCPFHPDNRSLATRTNKNEN